MSNYSSATLMKDVGDNLTNVPSEALGAVLDQSISDQVLVLILMRSKSTNLVDDALIIMRDGHSFRLSGPCPDSDDIEAHLAPVVETPSGVETEKVVFRGIRSGKSFNDLVTELARGVRANRSLVVDGFHDLDDRTRAAGIVDRHDVGFLSSHEPHLMGAVGAATVSPTVRQPVRVSVIVPILAILTVVGIGLIASQVGHKPMRHVIMPAPALTSTPHPSVMAEKATDIEVPNEKRHGTAAVPLPLIHVPGNDGGLGKNLSVFGIHPGAEVGHAHAAS